jgi:hypothetical protein
MLSDGQFISLSWLLIFLSFGLCGNELTRVGAMGYFRFMVYGTLSYMQTCVGMLLMC